jgi:hypothetical protein
VGARDRGLVQDYYFGTEMGIVILSVNTVSERWGLGSFYRRECG